MPKFLTLLFMFFVSLPANADLEVYVHYLCSETRIGEPAGIVDVYIANGLNYPGAPRGVRISSASGSRVFQIKNVSQADDASYSFDFENGGIFELNAQKWRNKFVGKGKITLHLPGKVAEVYNDCEVDTREVGFTIGN